MGSTSVWAACKTEAEIPASTPTEQFVDHGDGTVTDTKTGLMWAKCSIGQTITDCTGTATPRSWRGVLLDADASALGGYNDWRAPNIRELQSIVEQRCENPAINEDVFPNTPSTNYQSGSPSGSDAANSWYVNFNDGTSLTGVRFQNASVRLVRGGQ
ncbi:MAG: DUF1566 domain-containing protein [Pseudomonadota bacterium]